MEDLTPAQKLQLGTWVVQRDAIILSISHKRDEEKVLIDSVNQLCKTKSEVYDEIQQSIGRLEELKKKEAEFATLTTSENAELRVIKSQLQTEIIGLETSLVLLKSSEVTAKENVSTLINLFEKLFDKTNGLESLVSGIVKVSSESALSVKNILITAGEELQKVVDIGEKNVNKTNKLLLDIPKIVVDLHRDIIERRTIARNRLANNGVEPKML